MSCPAVLLSFPALPESVWATHCHLASSNQCLAVRRRLTIIRADYWEEGARVVGCRIATSSVFRHRANLFELHSLLPSKEVATAFRSRLREVDVTRPIVGFFVKHLCEAFLMKKRLRLKSSLRRDPNPGPLGRNITKQTVFH